MSESVVQCEQLYKSFGRQTVIHDLSLQVAPGQLLTLLGPSGCGKTTLLRLIAGLERPEQGRITIAGQVVSDPPRHTPTEKRRVGMVFQDYAIFPHLTVWHNVLFGLGKGPAASQRAQTMLEMVGLTDQAHHMPHELSGGQQQRVALARALAPEPAVLLLDEPFSNLDANLRLQVRQEVRQLLHASHTTAIFVTHDQEEALALGDVVGLMRAGQIEQLGAPHELYHQPHTLFAARFLGQADFLPGVVTEVGVATPLGTLAQRVEAPAGVQVTVAVRPDDVQLTLDGQTANAVVVDRHFSGLDYLYVVRLEDGTLLHSRQPHTRLLAPGLRLQVGLQPDHPLPCFLGERALAIRPVI